MKLHAFAALLLVLGTSTVFAKKTTDLQPHLVLPMQTEVTPELVQCLRHIESKFMKFCPGVSNAQTPMLEIFLRDDYRGEFGAAADRGEVLKGSFQSLSNTCQVALGMNAEEFSSIVGTPLSALGTDALASKTMTVLDATAMYWFDMAFKDYMNSGKNLSPRSQCSDGYIGL